MPRFFFSVYDGVSAPDLDGTVLPDAKAARAEASRFVGDLLSEEPMRLALGEVWLLEVSDASRAVLLRVEITQAK